MLRLYSTIVVFVIILLCAYKVENVKGKEIQYGICIVGLVPIVMYLLTIK